uniref:RING-type domain-containing protein n=1 Tax=Ananas comosus var. bracteatus TaxID=296719 RepID=A0A6V7PUM7_ANACO|nr:unnamed protein product [Ananas comosus var. bracteatus]
MLAGDSPIISGDSLPPHRILRGVGGGTDGPDGGHDAAVAVPAERRHGGVVPSERGCRDRHLRDHVLPHLPPPHVRQVLPPRRQPLRLARPPPRRRRRRRRRKRRTPQFLRHRQDRRRIAPVLPILRLRGDRGGLECAVCLSRYDDAELLRLLPGCRHAFHLECIDRWLDAHSSCPLCRTKISAAAAARFNQSGRFDSGRDLLGLFVEREPEAAGDLRRSSSRFSIGGSFRRTAAAAANTTPPPKFSSNTNYCTLREAADEGGGSEQIFDKFKHKIVVSDVVFQSRWSDVNSADLIALSSDMLRVDSGQRFSGAEPIAPAARAPAGESVLKIREEMERKRLLESKATKMSRAAGGDSAPTDGWNSTAMISPGARSMSEITNLSRFRGVRDLAGWSAEEKVHRLWLPIVRRTVHWFAGREQRPPPPPPPPPPRSSAHSKEVTDLGAIV